MKSYSLIFLLLICFCFIAQNESNRGYKVKVGDDLPDLVLDMNDGSVLTNQDLKGKVVVLQFTGSWCSVCRREMPHLESRVWEKFKQKDFLLLGIDIKEPKEKVDAFIKKMEITYPIAYDPKGEIFSKFTLEGAGVTRNIVINKKGEIVFLTRLFEEAEFEKMIKKIKELI